MDLGAGRKGLFSSTLSLPSLGKSNRWQAEALGAIVRGGLGGSEGPVCVWEKMDAFITM